jgi:hypothetical protein
VSQPSYHWVIELDGEAVATLPDTVRGAHTALHNTGNIGISYVGGTETMNAGGKPKDTRTPGTARHHGAVDPPVSGQGAGLDRARAP